MALRWAAPQFLPLRLRLGTELLPAERAAILQVRCALLSTLALVSTLVAGSM